MFRIEYAVVCNIVHHSVKWYCEAVFNIYISRNENHVRKYWKEEVKNEEKGCNIK